MRIASIKLRAAALGVEKIDASDSGGYLQFGEQPKVDPLAVVRLVQTEGRIYRMQGAHRLQFRKDLGDLEARFAEIDSLLQRLAADGDATQAMTG